MVTVGGIAATAELLLLRDTDSDRPPANCSVLTKLPLLSSWAMETVRVVGGPETVVENGNDPKGPEIMTADCVTDTVPVRLWNPVEVAV